MKNFEEIMSERKNRIEARKDAVSYTHLPTAVINSSLAGVYKNAIERGFDKVYGMLHGIQGLLDEQYIDCLLYTSSILEEKIILVKMSCFLHTKRLRRPWEKSSL